MQILKDMTYGRTHVSYLRLQHTLSARSHQYHCIPKHGVPHDWARRCKLLHANTMTRRNPAACIPIGGEMIDTTSTSHRFRHGELMRVMRQVTLRTIMFPFAFCPRPGGTTEILRGRSSLRQGMLALRACGSVHNLPTTSRNDGETSRFN